MSVNKKIKKKNQKLYSKKQINKFKKDLGLNEDCIRSLEAANESETPTKQINKNAGKKGWLATDIVVYRDPPKRNKTKIMAEKQSRELSDDPSMNLNNIRREVHSFAFKGFDKNKQQDVRLRQLIKLGAEPPKGKKMTIKELKEKKYQERQQELDKREKEKNQGYRISSIGFGTVKKKHSKKDKNDVGALDGQVGKHRAGITKLSKRDISTISSKKRKRR